MTIHHQVLVRHIVRLFCTIDSDSWTRGSFTGFFWMRSFTLFYPLHKLVGVGNWASSSSTSSFPFNSSGVSSKVTMLEMKGSKAVIMFFVLNKIWWSTSGSQLARTNLGLKRTKVVYKSVFNVSIRIIPYEPYDTYYTLILFSQISSRFFLVQYLTYSYKKYT